MIIDLERFIRDERPHWERLEGLLEGIKRDLTRRLSVNELKELHYLYQRASSDLAKLTTFAAEPELTRYLEQLVAQAYGQIHDTRERRRFAPLRWFFKTFPQTFRRRLWAFGLSVLITIVGCAFGGMALALDPDAKAALMPFSHLQGDPSERVRQEEERLEEEDPLAGAKSQFSASLMTHNTRVSIITLALGMTWGIGTIIVLFSNGVMLGAVVMDYLIAGEGVFLTGWLLPHGSVEIPSILIAGQAGILLGSALIGWGNRTPLKGRLREIGPDLVTLIFGVAILLIWAGIVEAFFSQYHEPVLPYELKIAVGCIELVLLAAFLGFSGHKHEEQEEVPGAAS